MTDIDIGKRLPEHGGLLGSVGGCGVGGAVVGENFRLYEVFYELY